MRTKVFIAVLCLVSANWAVDIAASETIELGPARISLELGSLGSFSVEVENAYSMVHKKPDFLYNITSSRIIVNGTPHLVQIEVHQMNRSEPLLSPISNQEQDGSIGKYFRELTAYLLGALSNMGPSDRDTTSGMEHCMEKSSIIPRGERIQTEAYIIGGRQGRNATINSDPENPLYIVACSPDEQNGSGSTVCVIGSDLPWETTEKLFNSVEIDLA